MSSADTDGERQLPGCQCVYDGQETISLPGIRTMCRKHHEYARFELWTENAYHLRDTKVHHQTGETTTHVTKLLGIDKFGRGLYLDTKQREVLRLVPRSARSYRADRDGDEKPLRDYPPRHGGGDGQLILGPKGRDHLVVAERYSVSDTPGLMAYPAACKWLLEQFEADYEAIQHLTDQVVDDLKQYAGLHLEVSNGRRQFDGELVQDLLDQLDD